MCCSEKKCIYISIPFFLISLGVLFFVLFGFDKIITSQIKHQTTLKEETANLWGEVPGKSNVTIHKDHYFFDIQNLQGIIYKNEKAIAFENGPFNVVEVDSFINRKYIDNYVEYNWYKYHTITEEEKKKEQSIFITNFNIVFYLINNLKFR